MAASQQPTRKLILHAHGHGHPSQSFTIPARMVIKYYGEFGKYCSVQTRFPARRICSSVDIIPRIAQPVDSAYLEDPPSLLEQSGAPLHCDEEGCTFAAANKRTLTRHIHARHVPRFRSNASHNSEAYKRYLAEPGKNRGFLLSPQEGSEQYMLFSPRITEARSHPGNTVFPNLFLGTDEESKKNPRRVYRRTTLEECTYGGTLVLLNLEDYITSDGRLRDEVPHPFIGMRAGSRLTLHDIVTYIDGMYPGERVDLFVIACLDGIPETTIGRVEESVQEAERPWRGLMNLGRMASSTPYSQSRARNRSANRGLMNLARVASSAPYLRTRARSRSANRRGNTRRNNTSTRRRGPNSRSAARPHVKDE